MAWWVDAGVDVLVDDQPRDWRAKAVASAPVAASAAPVETRLTLPDTLEAFVAWRLGPAAPEAAAHGRRVLMEGPVGAPLMAIVDCPDGSAILEGGASQLFDRMLTAIGLNRAGICLATFTTARPLAGRIGPELETQLAPLVRRHVALAAPKRLLIMGASVSRALLGTDGAARRGSLQRVNLEVGSIEGVAILPPGTLIAQPRGKAEAWRGLQLLIGEKP